jgi:hypothetical protein
MPTTMRAARMHAVGAPMSIDTIPVPKPGSTDVLVQVKACGMVPNRGFRTCRCPSCRRSLASIPPVS